MDQRLIVDTNVLIGIERGTIDRTVFADFELAVAALTIAEYRAGIEFAGPEHVTNRTRALTAILAFVEVLPFTVTTAAHHARLFVHCRENGIPRGKHDLIIASHAAETGWPLYSRDAKARFGDLPGVLAVSLN